MVHLVIRAVSETRSGSTAADRALSRKKGDVVGVQDAQSDTPPAASVLVSVLLLAREAAEWLTAPWLYRPEVAVLQRDDTVDGWRFRLENRDRRVADNAASIPAEGARDILELWGASLVRIDAEGPVLDWTVDDAIRNPRFWMSDNAVPPAIYELSYDPATGYHEYRVEGIPEARLGQAERAVGRYGGEAYRVLPDGAIAFSIDGMALAWEFRAELVRAATGTYKAHRYGIAPSDVDVIEGAGGAVEVSLGELETYLIDHQQEVVSA